MPSDRSLLGPADVDDERLAAMVADNVGAAEVELLTCEVEVAEYDIEALTTAGRYWVRGTARHAQGTSDYAFFVKVVHSWTRTAAFQRVPEALRELAADSLPWRHEPAVYRSDLAQRLPAGLSMPRAHAVLDLDEASAALWIEAVDVDPSPWTPDTFARAAYLLGRLAASPSVGPLATLGRTGIARGYATGRLYGQVLPGLRDEDLWRHPLVAPAFGADLRGRIVSAADSVPAVLDELDTLPLGTAHGDASTRNLLRRPSARDEIVLIDFQFWCQAPLGFDLSQLLLGELQLGERRADELAGLEELCLEAYVRGVHDEGGDVPLETVRRSHALLMLLFSGLSAVPLEVVYGMPPPGDADAIRQRAGAAEFILDLVDATG